MYSVIETESFAEWVDNIRDMPTRIRLRRRVNKAKLGNLGDIKAVGDGIWEMREFFGPGWRMYYIQRGDVLIVMLGGGDKSSQERDIAAAKAMAKEIDLRAPSKLGLLIWPTTWAVKKKSLNTCVKFWKTTTLPSWPGR